jgi:hypothetical protein
MRGFGFRGRSGAEGGGEVKAGLRVREEVEAALRMCEGAELSE